MPTSVLAALVVALPLVPTNSPRAPKPASPRQCPADGATPFRFWLPPVGYPLSLLKYLWSRNDKHHTTYINQTQSITQEMN